jgi:hypothetical protein
MVAEDNDGFQADSEEKELEFKFADSDTSFETVYSQLPPE